MAIHTPGSAFNLLNMIRPIFVFGAIGGNKNFLDDISVNGCKVGMNPACPDDFRFLASFCSLFVPIFKAFLQLPGKRIQNVPCNLVTVHRVQGAVVNFIGHIGNVGPHKVIG